MKAGFAGEREDKGTERKAVLISCEQSIRTTPCGVSRERVLKALDGAPCVDLFKAPMLHSFFLSLHRQYQSIKGVVKLMSVARCRLQKARITHRASNQKATTHLRRRDRMDVDEAGCK